MKKRIFECTDCGHVWEVEPCTKGGRHGYEISCSKCGSMSKMKIDALGKKHACGGPHPSHDKSNCGCCGH